jgi:hypothetical protein
MRKLLFNFFSIHILKLEISGVTVLTRAGVVRLRPPMVLRPYKYAPPARWGRSRTDGFASVPRAATDSPIELIPGVGGTHLWMTTVPKPTLGRATFYTYHQPLHHSLFLA